MKINNTKKFRQQFFKNNTFVFILACIATTALNLSNLAVSGLMKVLMDLISGVPGTKSLSELIVYTLLVTLLIVVTQMINYFTKPRFIRRAMMQYKDYVFKKLSDKSIASFSSESTTKYISALSNDSTTIEENYLVTLFDLVSQIIVFVGALAMMLYLSPELTGAAVAFSVLPIIASLITGNRMAHVERIVSDKNKSFLETLTDALNGFSVIKSFKAEKEIFGLFKKSNEEAESAKSDKRKITTIIGTIAAIAGFAAQMGVFIVGAYLAMSGKNITAGTVIVFVNLMNFMIQPIATVPQMLAKRKSARALIEKLSDSLAENIRDEGKEIDNTLQDCITIKNLSFGYDQDEAILNDINYTFEAGKKYAIVGASGSGKSTLLNTLLASHSNYSGEVFYDGVELRDINTRSLYDLVSVIQQKVFIFNAPIRDNITMFRNFPQKEIDRVIQLSGLSEFIDNKGQDYLCGENGSNLSGGEKQRIAIARSLLKQSSVLLVDEATASLDSKTAYQVSNSILELDAMTTIVVTHSLDSDLLKRYDCILTLKDGKIIESGDFASLMAKNNYFYSLYTVAAK